MPRQSRLDIPHLLRLCAAAVALHGIILGLCVAMKPLFPSLFSVIEVVIFWVLAVPALILARPFISILWKLKLMDAPGWFAWPKPLGLALAYLIWVVLLLGLAQLVRWRSRRK